MFGGCAVTGYCSFNRLLVSQSNLQASETECHCKNVLVTLCVRKVIAFCVERLLNFEFFFFLFKSMLLHLSLTLHLVPIITVWVVAYGRFAEPSVSANSRTVFSLGAAYYPGVFFTAFQLKAHCQPCVAFGVFENGFLILDLPDFAIERNVNSEIGFVTLITFLKRVQYA